MIRVLQVLEGINENSGVSAVVMNYYNHIDTEKIIFDFMIHSDLSEDTRKKIEKRGSKIYRMPSLSGKNIPRYIKELNSFWEEHREEYQIVHGHLPNAAVFYLGIAGKYGCPVRIIHSHSSKGADSKVKQIRNRVLNNLGVRRANTYFACSECAADYLFQGKTRRNVHIIHNAIDIKKFRYNSEIRTNMRRRYGISDETLVIGHVGRFEREKNHLFIIKIAEELRKQENIKFFLVGDGSLRRLLEDEIKKKELQDKFILTGSVEATQDYYQMMDVFLLPSLFEGLPVVGVEAQAAGLPCIFSENVSEEVALTENVRRISLGNVKQWTDAILESGMIRNIESINELQRKKIFIEDEAKNLASFYEQLRNNKT